MYRGILLIFYIILFVSQPLGVTQASDRWNIPKGYLAGAWKGEGRIIVSWCEQKQLSFGLQIDKDGNVSGTIGDAHIRHGKIELNNFIYRWMGNREYIIDVELSDYLIEKEKITRKSIRIFLDHKKPVLTGGFHTSGSKFGGKETMVLSGIILKLVKK
jgi:hypothetical protein